MYFVKIRIFTKPITPKIIRYRKSKPKIVMKSEKKDIENIYKSPVKKEKASWFKIIYSYLKEILSSLSSILGLVLTIREIRKKK